MRDSSGLPTEHAGHFCKKTQENNTQNISKVPKLSSVLVLRHYSFSSSGMRLKSCLE